LRRRELSVLIVEDDALQARLLCECLARTGLGGSVSMVYDGDEALAWLRRARDGSEYRLPDLVLLDFQLPGLDGAEVVQAIRAEPGLSHIPVLVVSTSAEPGDVARAYASGANCYIRKPSSFAGGVSMAEAIEEFWVRVATLPSM
jgi:CheY-like chemotaxis protein